MKSNVDLTIDRKFDKRIINLKSIVSSNKYKIGWRNIKDVSLAKDTRVLTGNKSQRRSKRFINEYNDFQYCECCGLNFQKRPYLRGKWMLCKNCDLNLESQEDIKGYWHRAFKRKKIKKIGLRELEDLIDDIETLEVVEETV